MSLRIGDRVPNFQLPTKDGLNRVFYFEVSGGPIVLVVARQTSKNLDECFMELDKCTTSLCDLGAEIFCIVDDLTKVQKYIPSGVIFGDKEGKLSDVLLKESNGTSSDIKILLLDPNQRVLGKCVIDDPKIDVGECINTLKLIRNKPRPQPVIMQYGAPALLMDNLIDSNLCNRLIENWKSDHQEGLVNDGKNNAPDPEIKKNREHVVKDADLRREIASSIGPKISPELEKAFNFDQPLRFEAFTVLSYSDDRKDFFAPHRDNLRTTQKRRFAMSLNLNDGYQGGELWFPEYGEHKYLPAAGAGVIFSCSLLHEALPVTKGQRWVMVTFMCD
jgi:predicted 2-oxoglutarate/Fe(II)-dependent dioxygenase YbiX